jgi:hypothetical protein
MRMVRLVAVGLVLALTAMAVVAIVIVAGHCPNRT